MPRVPLHLHHGPLAGQPGAGRRSPLPHAELPLGQVSGRTVPVSGHRSYSDILNI